MSRQIAYRTLPVWVVTRVKLISHQIRWFFLVRYCHSKVTVPFSRARAHISLIISLLSLPSVWKTGEISSGVFVKISSLVAYPKCRSTCWLQSTNWSGSIFKRKMPLSVFSKTSSYNSFFSFNFFVWIASFWKESLTAISDFLRWVISVDTPNKPITSPFKPRSGFFTVS